MATAAALAVVLPGCFLAMSPDGKRIVLLCGRRSDSRPADLMSAEMSGLAIVNADGSGYGDLPDSVGGLFASWSPDGRRVVFATPSVGKRPGGQAVFAAPADTRMFTPEDGRTSVIARGVGSPYVWAADSRQVVGFSVATGEWVWVDPATGKASRRVRLTGAVPFPANEMSAGAPGGEWLAAVAADPKFGAGNAEGIALSGDLYVVVAGTVRRVTTSGDVRAAAASADGKRVVFARGGAKPGDLTLRVQSYDPASGAVASLPFPSRLPGIGEIARAKDARVLTAVLSPGAERLVVCVAAGRRTECASMALDGSDPVRVCGEPTADSLYPVFSPDGRAMAALAVERHGEALGSVLTLYTGQGRDPRTVLRSPAK